MQRQKTAEIFLSRHKRPRCVSKSLTFLTATPVSGVESPWRQASKKERQPEPSIVPRSAAVYVHTYSTSQYIYAEIAVRPTSLSSIAPASDDKVHHPAACCTMWVHLSSPKIKAGVSNPPPTWVKGHAKFRLLHPVRPHSRGDIRRCPETEGPSRWLDASATRTRQHTAIGPHLPTPASLPLGRFSSMAVNER